MRPLACLVLGVLVAAAPAHAGPLELHADLRVGATSGWGIGGAQKEHDFFDQTQGGTFGFLVGLHVLFADVWIEHDQLTDGSSIHGTWTELGLGGGFQLPVQDNLELDFSFGAAFGVGTGRQISPPLDNAQISDKGFLGEVGVALEYRLGRFIAIGASVPAAWGYMFKNDVPANDTSNHYQTFHVMALGYVKFRLGL
jgi:hypothetical protein